MGTEDPIELAWRDLEQHWDDDAAHRKFVALCAAQGALAEAGKRYRSVRDGPCEVRAEQAKRRIDAVLGAALQTLELARSETPRRRGKALFVVMGMFVILLGYMLLSILRARSQ